MERRDPLEHRNSVGLFASERVLLQAEFFKLRAVLLQVLCLRDVVDPVVCQVEEDQVFLVFKVLNRADEVLAQIQFF